MGGSAFLEKDMAIYKASTAAGARARMAKRARRQRFWKENKKRIMIGFLVFLFVAFLALATPWGPDYYWNKIQETKMDTPGVVRAGTLQDLYKLGVFYDYTMRSDGAMKCYNEIGKLYFGFTLSEYSVNPETAFEIRRKAQNDIKKGLSKGPPFTVAAEDLPAVSYAIWRAGEIVGKTQSKQFVYRLYNDLYVEELQENHPEALDPQITNIVTAFIDRFMGRR